MSKIWTVASNEYRQIVVSRTFLLSLLLMPLLMGGMIGVQVIFRDVTDLDDRRIVVLDRTGELLAPMQEEAAKRNRTIFEDTPGGEAKQTAPRFILEAYTGEHISENPDDRQAFELELSEKVRNEEIFAFYVIGADALAVDGGDDDGFRYYSDSPTYDVLPRWLDSTTEDAIEQIRFVQAGLDQREINRLQSHAAMERLGLARVSETGEVLDAEEENRLLAFMVPFAVMMFLFFAVQMTSPVMLNSVIEEKMQKISEVLLACVTPYQLMLGKLIAGVLVGVTFSAVYLGSLFIFLGVTGNMSILPMNAVLWYWLYLFVGLLCYGSIFGAIGAACADIKDTQNFSYLIVVVIMLPMVFGFAVLEAPTSAFTQVVSLIPPLSAILMPMRAVIAPGPELWELLVGLVVNLAFALACTWAASRVFRVGLLAQGQTPTTSELFRWIFKG